MAALYVERGGVYWDLPGVDPWDEARDARLYAGPSPVVAHPPCNRWVSYGSQLVRGQDDGCFAAALAAVEYWGGVLEQPARSEAWRVFNLPRPARYGWVRFTDRDGWAVEVDQYAYGFPTRKLTWLYVIGCEPVDLIQPQRSPMRGCETLWSTERSRTPPAFRDVLLEIARSAGRVPTAA